MLAQLTIQCGLRISFVANVVDGLALVEEGARIDEDEPDPTGWTNKTLMVVERLATVVADVAVAVPAGALNRLSVADIRLAVADEVLEEVEVLDDHE